MITTDQISKLASKKNVNANAVANFLGSLGDMTASDAFANLRLDSKLYKWNAATVNAISMGITAHFARPLR